MGFYSHHLMYDKLMEGLLEEGHNLTIFTSFFKDYKDHENVTQHVFTNTADIVNEGTNMMIYKQTKRSLYEISFNFELQTHVKVVEDQFEHPEIQKIIKNKENFEFDLIIIECAVCSMIHLAELYDIPIVYLQAADYSPVFHNIIGNNVNPVVYSDLTLPFTYGKLSIAEMIASTAFYFFFVTIGKFRYCWMSDWIAKKHFGQLDKKVIDVLEKRLALFIINSNIEFGYERPVMSNTIRVGFMHVEPPKEITQGEIQNFIDNSPKEVIVMSFGATSIVNTMSLDTKQKFLHAFSKIPFNVIWRFEADEELEIPKNVLLSKWLQLADVLAHRNVRLFITHGGINSAYEAIDREVPMIVFPLAYDQPGNAKMMVNKGIAKELDLNTFTEEDLITAINEMMTNVEYLENIKTLKRLVYDQPMKPRELAVWHIEHVLRLGKLSYADYPGKKLSFWKRNFLFTFFITFLSTIWIARLIAKFFI